jgi:predicted secreted protein
MKRGGASALLYAVSGGLLVMTCREQPPETRPAAPTVVELPPDSSGSGEQSAASPPATSSPVPEPASAPAQRRVTEAEAGGEVVIVPGQNLVIELVARPSTGHVWHVEHCELGEPISELLADPSPGEGGATVQRFTWRRLAAGTAGRVRLVYRRRVGPTVKTYELSVRVQRTSDQVP